MKIVGVMCAALLLATAGSAIAAGHVRMPDGEVMLANYPPESLARGEEGAVGIRIRLNKDGRIKTCGVSQSSGYASLDAATCSLMIANARMKPFREDGGRRTEMESDGKVVWTLPADRASGEKPAFSSRVRLANAADTVICREQPRKGSVIVRERICLTAREWRQQIGYAQGELQGALMPGGPIF